jgi:hypothetical protein
MQYYDQSIKHSKPEERERERETGHIYQADGLVLQLGPEQCSLAWVLMKEFVDPR